MCLIRGADPLLIGLVGVVLMFGIWLRAVRWRILLKPLGRTTLTQSFSALTIDYLANNLLPARLGEIVRVVILHRDAGIPRAGSLGTIVVERLPHRLVDLGEGFLEGFANVASAGAVARVLLLSIASWTVEASVYFLVMRAMDIKSGGMWMATLVSSLSNLAGVIPAGPANVGPFEYFARETLLGSEFSVETAVAFAMAAHLVIFVPPSIIGGLLLLRGGFRGHNEATGV